MSLPSIDAEKKNKVELKEEQLLEGKEPHVKEEKVDSYRKELQVEKEEQLLEGKELQVEKEPQVAKVEKQEEK